MKNFKIEYVPHPTLCVKSCKDYQYRNQCSHEKRYYPALTWKTAHSSCALNVEYAEDTLFRYYSVKDLDNLEVIEAVKLVRDFNQKHGIVSKSVAGDDWVSHKTAFKTTWEA